MVEFFATVFAGFLLFVLVTGVIAEWILEKQQANGNGQGGNDAESKK